MVRVIDAKHDFKTELLLELAASKKRKFAV